MAKLIILSAEPENFAPTELKKQAEKQDIETEIINPDDCYISLCSAGEKYISHKGTKFLDAEYCIPRLCDNNLEYKIAIMDHIESMGIKMLNTGKSMRNTSNKILSQILLAQAGFKTPKTIVLTNDNQIEFAVKSLGEKFPIIVKTLFGTHGVGVIRADSMPSLKSIIQQLLKTKTEFMLQEFIEHDKSVRAYVLGDEVIVGAERSLPSGDFRTNYHQGSEITKYELSDEEQKQCVKASKCVGAQFSAVDYVMSGDDMLIFEINGSPGFEAIIEKGVDIEITKKVIDFLIGGDESESTKDKPKDEPKEEPKSVEEPKEEPKSTDEPEKGDNILGAITQVKVKFLNDDKPIDARVDTGAAHTSMHAEDIVMTDEQIKFRFGDYTYKFPRYTFKKIRSSGHESDASTHRPVITVDLEIDGVECKDVEMTLYNRKDMKYEIIIGRSTLIKGGFLVNPSEGSPDDKKEASEEE